VRSGRIMRQWPALSLGAVRGNRQSPVELLIGPYRPRPVKSGHDRPGEDSNHTRRVGANRKPGRPSTKKQSPSSGAIMRTRGLKHKQSGRPVPTVKPYVGTLTSGARRVAPSSPIFSPSRFLPSMETDPGPEDVRRRRRQDPTRSSCWLANPASSNAAIPRGVPAEMTATGPG
jgi:hypothetical protein